MTFRIYSKQFFLTYPKCPLRPTLALEMIALIISGKSRDIEEYILAQEKHQDGTDHLHVYLKLDERLNVRDATLFDLDGEYHGNYQAVRSPAKVKKYCIKGGNYIADPPVTTTSSNGTSIWMTARTLAKESKMEEALETLESNERSSRDLTLYGTTILTNLGALSQTKELAIARDLTTYSDLFEWDRRRVLILKGPTNCGKTTLAASLLPRALMIGHADMLLTLGTGHDGIIMDDMSFKHWPDESQIQLLDTAVERHIHVRYRVARIPAGTARIMTTNKEASEILNTGNPAILRRVQVVHWWGWDKDPSWAWD